MPRTRKRDPDCLHCFEPRSDHTTFSSTEYGEVLLCPGALEDNTFESLDEAEARTAAMIRSETERKSPERP